jgi:Cu-processing system permease protein
MIRAFGALTLTGFREARRNRVTLLIAGFAIALLLFSTLVADVSVARIERVLIDVGLAGMSLMLVVLAVFLSSSLLVREIERRTIFMIVSKPISRGLFLISRLAGNMLTLAVLLAAMTVVFWLELLVFNAPFRPHYVLAIAGLLVELLVLSSVGFAMSSFSGHVVSAMVTAGIFFAGHLAGDIYRIAERAKSVPLQYLGKATYYLLPNLDRLNYRPQACHLIDVPLTEALGSFAYGVAYAGVMVGIAVLVFARRDFK